MAGLITPVMDPQAPVHRPVMRDRVTELLAVPGVQPAILVDATVGVGGHAAALLAASNPQVHLVGFDRDEDALALASQRLESYRGRVTLIHAPFERLAAHVAPMVGRLGPVLGVLYDLGVSSLQLDRAERGFSFRVTGPLDMRMDRSAAGTAAQLVNDADEDELVGIIRRFGEERFARRIVAAIVRARPVRTTTALAAVIAEAVPAATRRPGLHPATRTFQALRIAVNSELDRFNASLPQALELTAAPAAEASSTGARSATARPGGTTSEARSATARPGGTTSEARSATARPGGTTSEARSATARPGGTTSEARSATARPGGTTSEARSATARPGGTTTGHQRGGRIVVLAYHSLEDRAAKRFFSDAAAGCICPPDLPVCGCGRVPLVRHLTRGAERPAAGEVAGNPRARAARLRAVERITGGNALTSPEP